MTSERLFYFIHGAATMYFLMAGLSRLCDKDSSRVKRLCGYILLFWGCLELKDLFFYATPIIRDNYISNLLVMVDMLAIPAGLCFVDELLQGDWSSLKRIIYYFSPYILLILLYAITDSIWIYYALFILSTINIICFLAYIYFAIKRYNKLLDDNYSDTESLHINWLREVVVMLATVFISWSMSCYYSSWIVDSCYQLLLIAWWVVVTYHADRQQSPSIIPETSLNLPMHGVLNDALVRKLEHLLSEEQIWKNTQLTLADLAAEIGTNRTYLSNYLNNTLNTTFYEYINSFRLEAALKIMNDPTSTATMVEIAEACGFNSISTFRRVFVRAKGCSLAEYRHQVIESNK